MKVILMIRKKLVKQLYGYNHVFIKFWSYKDILDDLDNESVKEIYVPVSKFPKRVPEEGDYVSVTVNVY